MKATYKGKREKKKASYLLNYSFAPNILSDSFSACYNLSEKHYYISRSFGGVQLHIYLIKLWCTVIVVFCGRNGKFAAAKFAPFPQFTANFITFHEIS